MSRHSLYASNSVTVWDNDKLFLPAFIYRKFVKKPEVKPTHKSSVKVSTVQGSLFYLAHIVRHFRDRSTWRQEGQQSPVSPISRDSEFTHFIST